MCYWLCCTCKFVSEAIQPSLFPLLLLTFYFLLPFPPVSLFFARYRAHHSIHVPSLVKRTSVLVSISRIQSPKYEAW